MCRLAIRSWCTNEIFPKLRKEFETALRLRPGYATAHQFYGYYLTAMGKIDEAIVERKKARRTGSDQPSAELGAG